MNLEPRSCWRCGRQVACLVERCERCNEPEVVACERCVEETGAKVLDWQAGRHGRICSVKGFVEVEPTGPLKKRGRPPVANPSLRTLQHRRQKALEEFHNLSISEQIQRKNAG